MSGLPSARLLVGMAIDLSASMKQSVRNQTGGQLDRYESFRRSLRALVRDAQSAIREGRNGDVEASIDLFVYGYGLREMAVCDLFSMMDVGAEEFAFEDEYSELKDMAETYGLANLVELATPIIRVNRRAARNLATRLRIDLEARQRLAELLASTKNPLKAPEAIEYIRELADLYLKDTTLPIEKVALLLDNIEETLGNAEVLMYGHETPMREAMDSVGGRFSRELGSRPDDTIAILLVLSDGLTTDGDPLPVIEQIKAMGVTVISCFFASQDVANPRILYRECPRGDRKGIPGVIQDWRNQSLFVLRHLTSRSLFTIQHLANQGLRFITDNWKDIGFGLLYVIGFPVWTILQIPDMLPDLRIRDKIRGLVMGLSVILIVVYFILLFSLFVIAFIVFLSILPLLTLAVFVYYYHKLYETYEWRRDDPNLMFNIASTIHQEDSAFARFLLEKGWTIRPGAKLFVQVNHSEILEEFVRVVLGPLGRATGGIAPRGT